MNIIDVRVVGRDLPLSFVEVQTDEGLTGIGSTGSPSNIISAIIEQEPGALRELLIGQDPLDTGRLWRKMFRDWQAQRGRGAEGGLAVNAMGAIDMALWDIVGKAQDKPLHKVLGGAVQGKVMAYASASAFRSSSYESEGPLVHKSREDLVEEIVTYVSQGFKAIKYGWGNHFHPEDEATLAAIREAAGPDIRLMIDFGCPAYWSPGWNAREAAQAGQMLARYGVYFFEEPMPPFDVEGHAAVKEAADVNIATGESLTTIYEFQRFIDRRAVDIVQPDAAQMGVSQVVHVVRTAETAGMLSIPHGPWSALTVAAHLNILATLANGPMVEYPAFASFEEGSVLREMAFAAQHEIVERPPVLEDGFLQLPSSPGLGLGDFVHDGIARLESIRSERRPR